LINFIKKLRNLPTSMFDIRIKVGIIK